MSPTSRNSPPTTRPQKVRRLCQFHALRLVLRTQPRSFAVARRQYAEAPTGPRPPLSFLLPIPISLAPGFSRVFGQANGHNRFSGFSVLPLRSIPSPKPLKRLPNSLLDQHPAEAGC